MKPMTFATKTINGKAFKKSRELPQLVEIKDIILDLNEDKGNEIDQLIAYEEGAVPSPASHISPLNVCDNFSVNKNTILLDTSKT